MTAKYLLIKSLFNIADALKEIAKSINRLAEAQENQETSYDAVHAIGFSQEQKCECEEYE